MQRSVLPSAPSLPVPQHALSELTNPYTSASNSVLPIASFRSLLSSTVPQEAKREATALPALDPATPLPRGLRALRRKGGQWIWRLAVYSSSLRVGFVARFSGVCCLPTAPSNKIPPNPARARLLSSSLVGDLEVVWPGLVGKTAAATKPWSFVLRIRRRHGRVPSNSARGSRSLLRGLLAGVGSSYVGAREIWRSGARFVARGGGFGDSSSTRSTGDAGSVAEKARGLPRSTRPNGCAPPVTARSFFDSQSHVWRWCDLGLLGRWWLVLLRRPVAAAAGFGHGSGGRETSQGPICNFQFFGGLSVIVLGHLYLLEFARDFCACTVPICVI
jgi:hypothetical protein